MAMNSRRPAHMTNMYIYFKIVGIEGLVTPIVSPTFPVIDATSKIDSIIG